MGGEDDQNIRKQLQIDLPKPKETKNTPWCPNALDTKGFYLFWAGCTDKKETAFRLSLWCARRDLKPCYVNRFSFDRLAKTDPFVVLDDHRTTCQQKTIIANFAKESTPCTVHSTFLQVPTLPLIHPLKKATAGQYLYHPTELFTKYLLLHQILNCAA